MDHRQLRAAALDQSDVHANDLLIGTFGTVEAAVPLAARISVEEKRTAFIFKYGSDGRNPAGSLREYYEVHADPMVGRTRGGEIVAFVSCTVHPVQ